MIVPFRHEDDVACEIENLAAGAPGAYALLIRVSRPVRLRIGRFGTHAFQAGWYLYVGSALGPGGVAARVARHLRTRKRVRWHIDYLLSAGRIVGVWVIFGRQPRECLIARGAQNLPAARVPAPGFGASDCDCTTHLFHFKRRPRATAVWSFDLALSDAAFRAACGPERSD